jgi:hypothetical protein
MSIRAKPAFFLKCSPFSLSFLYIRPSICGPKGGRVNGRFVKKTYVKSVDTSQTMHKVVSPIDQIRGESLGGLGEGV